MAANQGFQTVSGEAWSASYSGSGTTSNQPVPARELTLTERVMQLTQEKMELEKRLNALAEDVCNRLVNLERKVG